MLLLSVVGLDLRFDLPDGRQAFGIGLDAFRGDFHGVTAFREHAHGGEIMREDKLVGLLLQLILQGHVPVVAGDVEADADGALLLQADQVENVVHRGGGIEKFLEEKDRKYAKKKGLLKLNFENIEII